MDSNLYADVLVSWLHADVVYTGNKFNGFLPLLYNTLRVHSWQITDIIYHFVKKQTKMLSTVCREAVQFQGFIFGRCHKIDL